MLRERIALLQLIGDFDLQRGNHRVAIEALEECLILARQINVLVLISPILRNLGLAYYLVGERSKARDYYQESIHIDERIGNVGGVIIANDNLGLVYLVNGEYPAAHTCFQKAIRLSHAHNMPQRFANVLTNLGLLYFVTGDLLRAETTLLRSYTLFHELGEARSLADCLYQMGDVALARGDSEVALKYGEEALMLARQVGSTIYEAYSLRVIGEALLAIHQPIEAAVVLDQAQKFQSRIDDPFGRVLLLRATLLLAQAQGADQEAKRLARMGLELAHAQESPYLIARMQELD
jgi:tetratricopeptide (TPR) repeat protein